MPKKATVNDPNKDSLVKIRLSEKAKNRAKMFAHLHFNGNLSALGRYALENFERIRPRKKKGSRR